GVVTVQWELTEARLARSACTCVGRTGGHVELQRQSSLRRAELGARLREMIAADIRDHDVHPGPEQGLGNAEPDAAGAPRHECGLAWQVLHAAIPPMFSCGAPADSACAARSRSAGQNAQRRTCSNTYTLA